MLNAMRSRSDSPNDGATTLTPEEAHRRIANLENRLREAHHRIKNQLQMINGFLNLHASRADNPCCADLLRQAMGCVAGVAEVHKQLSGGGCSIDCGRYFRSLAGSLRMAYALPDDVHLEIHAPDSDMDPGLMATAGVLATELVSNSARHAFPDGRGRITVDLVEGRHTLTIIVQDDGMGLPDGMDPHGSDSLGFSILRATTQQWGGRLIVSSNTRGTSVTISLPKPD